MDGERLKELREKHMHTIESLADYTGIDEDRLRDLENFSFTPYSSELNELARAFNMTDERLKGELRIDEDSSTIDVLADAAANVVVSAIFAKLFGKRK